jgi:diguanylate cyclase (GGDEF)-like protein
MLIALGPQAVTLDMPTLLFVAVCMAAVLGLFLIIAWLQERSVRALAWWGAAYLIGASSMAMWSAPAPLFNLPADLPAALIFVACGMIWNGVRLFHGKAVLAVATFAGAAVWLLLCQLPSVGQGSNSRIAIGAAVVAVYTFFIALELGRERRKSLYSRTAALLVPLLHAAIFLMPLSMKAFFPDTIGAEWLVVFALETMLYALGTAIIVLMMVKDYHLHIYRSAASTDHLTGLLNRRAFLENAHALCAAQAKRRGPVTLLMFDLDHFKSINDRFGHAVGDEVLREFARVARSSMRANDIIGRLGGEEFSAIVPAPVGIAEQIAERLRASFQDAGVAIGMNAIGATVSIGLASSSVPVIDIDALLARADAALYRAKHDGRNRMCTAEHEPAPEPAAPARPTAAAPTEPPAGPVPGRPPVLPRKPRGRLPNLAVKPAHGNGMASRLLYRR